MPEEIKNIHQPPPDGNIPRRQRAWPALVVGITGSIASGKTAAARLLAGHGIPVIDADGLAREAVQPGSPALRDLARAFGGAVLLPDGSLNRPALLDLMLSSPRAKKQVEEIIHPRVLQLMDGRLREFAASGSRLAVVEVPLLFEAGWAELFDFIVTVTAPEGECLRRTVERNRIPEEKARRWLDSQMPQEEKAGASDFVIVNDGDLAGLERKIRRLLARLRGK